MNASDPPSLLQSNPVLARFIHSVPVAISLSVLEDDRFLDVNQGLQTLLGYSRTEMIGHTAEELGIWTSPRDRQRLINRLQNQGQISDFECTLRSRFGHTITGLLNAEMVTVAGRECILAIIVDISDRKQSEHNRQRAAALLQATLESTGDGILATDPHGHTITCNHQFYEMWNIDTQFWGSAAPLERLRYLARKTKEPVAFKNAALQLYRFPIQDQDLILTLRNGRIFACRSRPQWLGDTINGVVLSFADITALHRRQQELEASEIRFRSFVEQSWDGIIQTDEKGVIIEWNQALANITGIPRQQAIGQYVWDIYHSLYPLPERSPEEYRRIHAQAVSELSNSDHPQPPGHLIEINYQHPANRTVNLQMVAFPIHTRMGALLGAIYRDVTAVKQTEERLRLMDSAVRHVNNGVIITNPNLPDNPVIYVNPAFEAITGYAAVEVVGRNCRFLQGDERDPEPVAIIRHALLQQRPCRVTLRNYRKDGTLFWNDLSISPILANDGQLLFYVGIQTDISEHKANEERLRYLGTHDGLTGLYNSGYFRYHLENLKPHQLPACVVMADVDRLKLTNDTYGHPAGDETLISHAALFNAAFRPYDLIARLGGDEFAVLMYRSSEADAQDCFTRLRAGLEEANLHPAYFPLSISLGAADIPSADDARQALRLADQRMYDEKEVHHAQDSYRK